jgi:hypothetical protein
MHIRAIAILLLTFHFEIGYCQKVEVLSRTRFASHKISASFEYIEAKTPAPLIKPIATIKASGTKNNSSIPNLFFQLQNKAIVLGANSFKINSYKRDRRTNEAQMTLDIFFTSDSLLTVNANNHPKNEVFIFGDGEETGDTKSFNLDQTEIEILPGSYYQFHLRKGDIKELNAGGILGQSITMRGKEKMHSKYLTVTGYGLPPDFEESSYFGKIFDMQIHPIDRALGRVLVSLLKPSK